MQPVQTHIEREAPASAGSAPSPPPPVDGRISASHILVSYRGALRAPPTTSRTREEARQRAFELTVRARQSNTSFEQLARRNSDGPSGPKGGQLGSFTRQQMVKAFSDTAFSLDVGQVSEVVETDFGFHIIKRTK